MAKHAPFSGAGNPQEAGKGWRRNSVYFQNDMILSVIFWRVSADIPGFISSRSTGFSPSCCFCLLALAAAQAIEHEGSLGVG